MTLHHPLGSLEISNKCVVLCDLRQWSGIDSPAWLIFTGSQDAIGCDIASILDEARIDRIDDFGGVSKSFLCDAEEYKDNPPKIKGNAAVFSFTPKNRIKIEGQDMARVAKTSGYKILVMTVQKDDKFGKVWVLRGILHNWLGQRLTYYEDTNSIIDELKSSPEEGKVIAIHVQVPGYEENVAVLADRVISQAEYQQEVLEYYH